MASQIRSENELFIAEIINSHLLENLTPAQLAAVVCAITTEDLRIDMPYLPFSEPVRKTLNQIKNIRRRIDKVQNSYLVEAPCYINTYFSSLIELWVEGSEWESIAEQVDIGEGDIVRAFKRTVDVLRQFTVISNVPDALVFVAREAIEKIQREPVNID
jgi:superfamily II RNA helicase